MGFLKTLALAAGIALAGCNNSSTVTQQPVADTTESDTINYALNEDSVKLQPANTTPPEGFYSVMLPCTNCKGIEHTVLFNRDLSFQLEEKVLDANTITTTTGTWKPANGDIWLYKDSSVVARYTWKQDTLNFIDLKSGVRIPLRQLPDAQNVPAWASKGTEGVEVFGVGNEPFWNISIDEQKSIVFTVADWVTPLSFKPAKPLATGDSIVYQARNDTVRLRVTLYKRFCSDGMSDNVYPNTIRVQYNDLLFEGCAMLYK